MNILIIMKHPEISIVVPVYNSESTINACIISLINQNYPKEKYEIIVVDNGSTDNTSKILQKFRKRIRLLKEPKKGSYCARNKGLNNARGDIIAFTDSDCVVDRNWLLHISKAFEDKRLKLVGGNIKALKTDNTLLRYYDIFGHPQALFFSSVIPFFATANMAVRKKDLQSVRFNESLESGGDVEFCLRLIKDKREMYYEPKAIIGHLYNDSLIGFMKKQYHYGKWHKFRKQSLSIHSYVSMPNYLKIFTNYGVNFLFLRILQDVSYKYGLYLGIVKK